MRSVRCNGNVVLVAFILVFLTACSENQEHSYAPIELTSNSIELAYSDIDPVVDSVLYQALFKWQDQFIGIAEPLNDEHGKRGLRLQLLKMRPDSSFELISESPYGYDSRTFFPSYFTADERHFFLVNTGERESWGNKVLELKNQSFSDLGFIDAALLLPSETEDDGFKFENIAKAAHLTRHDADLEITFQCDSIILFDDQKGGFDKILNGKGLKYGISGDQCYLKTNS